MKHCKFCVSCDEQSTVIEKILTVIVKTTLFWEFLRLKEQSTSLILTCIMAEALLKEL
jgi:hypothetical protein